MSDPKEWPESVVATGGASLHHPELERLRKALEAKDAEIARLREALEVIEDTQPMWEGGVRRPSVAALDDALYACRSIARAALGD
jgi:DNA-binding transcriptional regulator YiaG